MSKQRTCSSDSKVDENGKETLSLYGVNELAFGFLLFYFVSWVKGKMYQYHLLGNIYCSSDLCNVLQISLVLIGQRQALVVM